MPRLVEFPEPCVRQPVKPPVRQLVELLELLDHQPLELQELLIPQLAEFLGLPVERRERSSLSRRILYVRHGRKYGGTEKINPQRTAVEPK